MPDWIADPFAGEIARRALLEIVILSAVCGPLGVWVLLGREAYAAESMGHGMLPGLVLAALIGVPLAAGAAAGVIVTVALLTFAGTGSRLGSDTGTAVAITALTGLGALLALSADAPPRLDGLLFGDLLGVTDADLAISAAVALVVVAALAAGRRRLLRGMFDAGSASATVIVLGMLGLTTAVAAPALGSLLALALLLAPAAAGLAVASSVRAATITAAAVAASAGVLGLMASHHLETAAGASVALCALAAWPLALVLTRRRGLETIPVRT